MSSQSKSFSQDFKKAYNHHIYTDGCIYVYIDRQMQGYINTGTDT